MCNYLVLGRSVQTGKWEEIDKIHPVLCKVKHRFLFWKWEEEEIVEEETRSIAVSVAKNVWDNQKQIVNPKYQDVVAVEEHTNDNEDCAAAVQYCFWKNGKWQDDYPFRTIWD